jgi:hypothetical protein
MPPKAIFQYLAIQNIYKKLKLLSSPTHVWERRKQHNNIKIVFISV